MINRYSKLPLAGKILIPILSTFLGMWTVGTVSVGYIETQKQAYELQRETQNAAFQISKEIAAAQRLLGFKAKSITDVAPLTEAVAAQDQQALLRLLLPLKASLELDLLKVIDQNGAVLSDLRSSVVGSARLQDAEIMELAQKGLMVTSIVVPADSMAAPLLIKSLSVTSKQDDVGTIIVGYALTPAMLEQMLGAGRQQLVLLQNSTVIAATLPVSSSVSWTQPLPPAVRIDKAAYLSHTIELPQVADERLQAVVLTPLAAFQASQRQLWLLVGGFGLLGGLLISAAGLWVTRLITRRITELTKATQKLADGDLAVRIPAEGCDEVATLATGFNHMTEQLKHRDRKIKLQLEKLEQLVKELQQMPEQVHTEKMAGLGQMVAGIAHEINNPVCFIYSNVPPAKEYVQDLVNLIALYQQHFPEPPATIQETESLIDLDFVTEDLPKLLDSMQSGAQRIREIVLSLRNFSRKDEAVMKSVNLHEGLDSTLVILGHRLKAQPSRPAIEVVKAYGALPRVDCFAGEINQVFMNLLSNAIDALEAKMADHAARNAEHSSSFSPKIWLQTAPHGNDWVTITIVDNGPGIPEEIRSKLFDPFFTTKEVGKGTGLGLSISYQIIVEKHGGKIWCEPQPNQGVKFVIQVPTALSAARSHAK
ncbi:MAG: HAMP domain-containing protein [Leptolyngbya sp. SIO4C1]|nr:HAMP domain-containing protein [Leptolyngbya sp. SIO4C1]